MRLPVLAAACVLVLAAPALADDKEKDRPKPNTLTAKEIADGWIMLFDGESTFGWKVEGTAEVKAGALIIGPKATKLTSTTRFPGVQANIAYRTGDGKPATGGKISHGDVASAFAKTISLELRVPWTGGRAPAHPFVIEVPEGQTIILERLHVRPVNTDPEESVGLLPLFTGKNLDGWKVNAADPKRMSSKFAVTKDGELSVKNGPGDLVTEKEFANFVLQFECKTLGEGLNSGIFFRCIPGQYQNGYEAQVQNAFLNNDRTKPKDFGTGAIYRRVPARKVVSNDNEWFTMTVVADGKHIATWVNGYQTVDWTDDRKENDNPRQGYRAAKGPLSIQGHDPTTDLLFRNIRIAELPGK
jgi:hypothetical protein